MKKIEQKTEQKITRSTFNILFYINRSKVKADGTDL